MQSFYVLVVPRFLALAKQILLFLPTRFIKLIQRAAVVLLNPALFVFPFFPGPNLPLNFSVVFFPVSTFFFPDVGIPRTSVAAADPATPFGFRPILTDFLFLDIFLFRYYVTLHPQFTLRYRQASTIFSISRLPIFRIISSFLPSSLFSIPAVNPAVLCILQEGCLFSIHCPGTPISNQARTHIEILRPGRQFLLFETFTLGNSCPPLLPPQHLFVKVPFPVSILPYDFAGAGL